MEHKILEWEQTHLPIALDQTFLACPSMLDPFEHRQYSKLEWSEMACPESRISVEYHTDL